MIPAFRLTSLAKILLTCFVAAVAVLGTVACETVPLLAPTGSTIVLTSAASALPSGGKTTIIAQVLEASGTVPHPGTQVIFTTTLGTISPSQPTTDINGRVTAVFDAGPSSGTATITANSGAATGGTGTNTGTGGTTTTSPSNVVRIVIGVAAIGGISVSASPTTLSANGGSSTITAIVRDINGNALPDVPVNFATDAGSLSASSAMTDLSGVAQVTLSTFATATVTATAGVAAPTTGTTPTTTSGTAKITVTSGPTVSIAGPTTGSGAVGLPVTFTVTSAAGATAGSPIRSVTVNFGDGESSSVGAGSASVTHVYRSTGTYTVTATATDITGSVATAQTSILILRAPRPTVVLTPPTAGITVNVPATFGIAATAPTGQTITDVVIDWGDGTVQPLAGNVTSASHVYTTKPGGCTYTVRVNATDSSDSTGSAFAIVGVASCP
jgi:adhesin/invasin